MKSLLPLPAPSLSDPFIVAARTRRLAAMSVLLAGVLGASVLTGPAATSATQGLYAPTNLGTLPGTDWSVAVTLNQSPSGAVQVTGDTAYRGSYKQPFFWSAATGMLSIGQLSGTTSGRAHALNNNGQVVGVSRRPFIWSRGTGIQEIGTLASIYPANPGADTDGTASDINDGGQVVGWTWSGGEPRYAHAFLWDADHGIQDLNGLISPGSGWWLQEAFKISADGTRIIGVGTINGQQHAFMLTYNAGASGYRYDVVDLGAYPAGSANSTSPMALNSSGAVAGSYYDPVSAQSFALFWPASAVSPVAPIVVGGFNGSSTSVPSTPYGMNESGAMAGVWRDSANNRHAFYWDPSRGPANMLDLGTLGGTQSAADGGYNADGPLGRPINAAGQVVGWAQTKSQTVAFVWSPASGQMQNLNGLLSGKSPFSSLQRATAISDAGQIVGFGVSGGQTRAFLLSP